MLPPDRDWAIFARPCKITPINEPTISHDPPLEDLHRSPQGPSSSADPIRGDNAVLPDSALAKLTKALKRNSNQVPLPKFNGNPSTLELFKDKFVEYYTAKR